MPATMIQIRNVPADVHRVLKARAAREGLTLSDYLLRAITEVAHRPTFDDLVSRIRTRGSPAPFDSAAAVRAEREGRR